MMPRSIAISKTAFNVDSVLLNPDALIVFLGAFFQP